MGTFVVIGLLIITMVLFLAKKWISDDTLQRLANATAVVSLIVAVIIFVIPSSPPPSPPITPSPSPLTPSIPVFTPTLTLSKQVLLDTTHGILSGNEPNSGAYSTLLSIIQELGYTVHIIDSGVSNLDLSNYNTLVINLSWAWNSPYSEIEAETIYNFVANGGGLILMGNHPNTPNDHIESISKRFGVTFGESFLANPTSNFPSHPIFANVTELYVKGGGSLNVSSNSISTALDSSSQVSIAVTNYEQGKVVIIGDFEMWRDPSITYGDNETFFKNVFAWVTAH